MIGDMMVIVGGRFASEPGDKSQHETKKLEECFYEPKAYSIPTNGVSTLSWWWGLSSPETLRAMPAVA
jgi:hypothetical protein